MNRSIALLVAAVFLLTGCSDNRSLKLAPGENTFEPCSDLSTVLVTDLGRDRADCSMKGGSLTFPDGTELPMDEFSAGGNQVATNSPSKYSWVSVGNYGIVAAVSRAGCKKTELWGSPEGKNRVLEAFGKGWPCN